MIPITHGYFVNSFVNGNSYTKVLSTTMSNKKHTTKLFAVRFTVLFNTGLKMF